MNKHFNNLSPAEAERLAILSEECAEVIQVIGKIQRHGYESYNPFDESRTRNRDLLTKELGHIRNAEFMMVEARDINVDHIEDSHIQKSQSIKKYLHHQNES